MTLDLSIIALCALAFLTGTLAIWRLYRRHLICASIVSACIEAKSQHDNIGDIRIVDERDIDLASMATRKSKLPGVSVEYFTLADTEGEVARGIQAVEIKSGWFIVIEYWVR